jgi:hypothetical protein
VRERLEVMERMVALSKERIEFLEREIERRGEADPLLRLIVAGLTQTAAQLSVRVPVLEAPRMPPIKLDPADPADVERAGPDREDPERAQPERVEPERPLTEEPVDPPLHSRVQRIRRAQSARTSRADGGECSAHSYPGGLAFVRAPGKLGTILDTQLLTCVCTPAMTASLFTPTTSSLDSHA